MAQFWWFPHDYIRFDYWWCSIGTFWKKTILKKPQKSFSTCITKNLLPRCFCLFFRNSKNRNFLTQKSRHQKWNTVIWLPKKCIVVCSAILCTSLHPTWLKDLFFLLITMLILRISSKRLLYLFNHIFWKCAPINTLITSYNASLKLISPSL